jgi:hypothetical protein
MGRLQRFVLVLLELVLVQRARNVALAVGAVPRDGEPPQVEAQADDDGHDQNEHDQQGFHKSLLNGSVKRPRGVRERSLK